MGICGCLWYVSFCGTGCSTFVCACSCLGMSFSVAGSKRVLECQSWGLLGRIYFRWASVLPLFLCRPVSLQGRLFLHYSASILSTCVSVNCLSSSFLGLPVPMHLPVILRYFSGCQMEDDPLSPGSVFLLPLFPYHPQSLCLPKSSLYLLSLSTL